MSVGLADIRERMVQYLAARGVEAAAAWPEGRRPELRKPVTAVSLRECKAGPAGFQNYLGERYNEETGMWEELYGRSASLTFGLDLYAPAEGGGAALQAAFDALAEALAQGGPEGLSVEEFSCGETEYDKNGRLLKRTAQAVCRAYLCTAEGAGDIFVEFELRGGLEA